MHGLMTGEIKFIAKLELQNKLSSESYKYLTRTLVLRQ